MCKACQTLALAVVKVTMSKQNILVINSGSSSIKFAVINPQNEHEYVSGLAERLSQPEARIIWKQDGEKTIYDMPNADHDIVCQKILHLLEEQQLTETLAAIGHRVVHGGEHFKASTLINDDVVQAIEDCKGLAPLHNPAHLLGIRITQKYFPNLPQAAVFDTSFHQTMPPQAYLYAIPHSLYRDHHVRRYGFHGTSYRFVTGEACQRLNIPVNESNILCAHLGNGCSAAAIYHGQSVDTTMGLTPLEGLVMGTRCGNIDANIFNFLHQQLGYDIDRITTLLNKESGLLGLSELSNDCRTLEEAMEQGHEQATLAIDVFSYVLAKSLSGLASSLDHIDALIFTGGIGENSRVIRAKVLQQLRIFGFQLDADANANNGKNNKGIITTADSPVALVINTNEELMIARDAAQLAGC